MVLSAISSSILAVDSQTSVTPIDDATGDVVAPGSTEVVTPASVVALSAAAQILSTTAAAAELTNEEQSALAFRQNVEQIAAQALTAEATLTQTAAQSQKSALTEAEANEIDLAVQSALADTALSEAVATTAIASSSTNTNLAVASTTTQTLNESLVVSGLPNSTLNTAAPTNASSPASAIVADQSPTPSITVVAPVTNPVTSITDPAVAAAIAAYRVGDGIFSEKDTLTDETPAESEIEVASITPIDGATLDLHDGARDDALNGSIWNWIPVQPVRKRLSRR